MSKLQSASKKEMTNVAIYTLVGVILMWIVFVVAHFVSPEKLALDYRVFLSGILGGVVTVANFYLMAVTVQDVAATEDQDQARQKMKLSYSWRMGILLIWVILVALLPFFHLVAGILPLLFPSWGMKLSVLWRDKDDKK